MLDFLANARFRKFRPASYDANVFSGLKDARPTPVIFGIAASALILVLVLLNCYHASVVWPPAKGKLALYATYSQPGIVAGTVIFKLGWAVALFGWFWLANRSAGERFAIRTAIAGLALIALGMLTAIVAFLY